jgi:hypothetical protein
MLSPLLLASRVLMYCPLHSEMLEAAAILTWPGTLTEEERAGVAAVGEEENASGRALDGPDAPPLRPALSVARPPPVRLQQPSFPSQKQLRCVRGRGRRRVPSRACAAWPAWPRQPCSGLARLGPLSPFFFIFPTPPGFPLGRPTSHPARPSVLPPLLFL